MNRTGIESCPNPRPLRFKLTEEYMTYNATWVDFHCTSATSPFLANLDYKRRFGPPGVERDVSDDGPARRTYGSISMPNALIDRAQRLIENFPELGYTNKTSLAEEGMRRWLEREEERAAALQTLYAKKAGKPSLDFTKPRKR